MYSTQKCASFVLWLLGNNSACGHSELLQLGRSLPPDLLQLGTSTLHRLNRNSALHRIDIDDSGELRAPSMTRCCINSFNDGIRHDSVCVTARLRTPPRTFLCRVMTSSTPTASPTRKQLSFSYNQTLYYTF